MNSVKMILLLLLGITTLKLATPLIRPQQQQQQQQEYEFLQALDDYYDDNFNDVWMENEYKARLLPDSSPEIDETPHWKPALFNADYNEPIDDESKFLDFRDLGHKLCTEVKDGPHFLQEDDYEIRPHFYHNITCKDSTGHYHQTRTKSGYWPLCQVIEPDNCVTVSGQINVFKRRLGEKCWTRTIKTIDAGCQCHH